MITFRYHVVSIVSVFLALAVGVALGGGPLKGGVDNSLVKELASRKHELATERAQIAALRATSGFYDSYAGTTAKTVLANQLNGRSVAFVTLPGADHATEASLGRLVRTAGGVVSASYAVGAKLGQAGNRQLVDELSSQMAAAAPQVKIPATATGYQRLGALIGRAVGATTTGGASYDAPATSIMSSLSTAGLMSTDGSPGKRTDLVIVLAGPASSTDSGEAANSIYSRVIGAMSGGSQGVVVAGPSSAARTGGLLRSIRDDVSLSKTLSTVDSTDTAVGRVVAVLGLARAPGRAGAYGAVDAEDGSMPGAGKS